MAPRDQQRANRRLTLWMLSAAVGMFGFGFALAPLYDVFCDITGLNGKTSGVAAAPVEYKVDTERTVTLELVANVNNSAEGWNFQPAVTKLRVHPGQAYDTSFVAENPSGESAVVQAVPSVSPGVAAQHLHKTECFCFTQQLFKPSESREMPLRFVIDPDLPAELTTLTLAYSLFKVQQTASR